MNSGVVVLVPAENAPQAAIHAFQVIEEFLESSHEGEVHEGCDQHPYDGEYWDSFMYGGRFGGLIRPVADIEAFIELPEIDRQKHSVVPVSELRQAHLDQVDCVLARSGAEARTDQYINVEKGFVPAAVRTNRGIPRLEALLSNHSEATHVVVLDCHW